MAEENESIDASEADPVYFDNLNSPEDGRFTPYIDRMFLQLIFTTQQ